MALLSLECLQIKKSISAGFQEDTVGKKMDFPV